MLFDEILASRKSGQAVQELSGLIDALDAAIHSSLNDFDGSAASRRDAIEKSVDQFAAAVKSKLPDIIEKRGAGGATHIAKSGGGAAYAELTTLAEQHAQKHGVSFEKAMQLVSKTARGIALTTQHRAEMAKAQEAGGYDPLGEAIAKVREERESAKTSPYRQLETLAEQRADITGETFEKAMTVVSKTAEGRRLTAQHREALVR